MTTLPLEDCMAAIIDYRGKTPRKTSSGVPLITAKVVKGGRIETPDEFIDAAGYDEWMRRGLPQVGDVVITTEAPLGEVAQLSESRVALAQRLILLRGKSGLLDNTYLKYLLMSEPMQAQLVSRASGTTVVGIKQSELRKVTLSLPAIEEQEAIATVLGSLDDKIEQNRRTGRKLEELARAVFKAWFVDFEPVKAKAAGATSFPSMPPTTFATLPSRLIQSHLGKIPEGWNTGTFGSVMSESTARNRDNKTSLVLSAVSSGELVPSDEHFRKRVYSKSLANYKLVSPSWIAFNPSRVNIGSIGINHDSRTGAVSPVYVVCSLDSDFEWFFEYYLQLPRCKERFDTLASGSVRQSLRAVDFLSIDLVIPDRKLVHAFNEWHNSIRSLKASLNEESNKLADLRDYLLPRLLSGKVRVRDAECMLS